MFLVVQEKGGTNDGKYHYLFLNESSLDETYGFTEIDSVVIDQLIVPPMDVFKKVDSIRELDNVNIALTDYGFWDIEANHTNNTTYSYRKGKKYDKSVHTFNNDITKLVTPTTEFDKNTQKQKVVEFSNTGPDANLNYEIDRIWSKNGDDWYYCKGLVVDSSKPEEDKLHRFKNYRSSIVGNNKNTLDLFGCTEHFAIYNSNRTDPIHILVNLTQTQFNSLLYSDATLSTYFIEWLYEQVTHDVPTGGATRGEWYLWNKYTAIAQRINAYLDPANPEHQFTGLEYQVVESDNLMPNDGKFSSIKALVNDYTNSDASTLYRYCDSLNNLVNNTGLGVNWLFAEGKSDP